MFAPPAVADPLGDLAGAVDRPPGDMLRHRVSFSFQAAVE
jgi:hypothetical protein